VDPPLLPPVDPPALPADVPPLLPPEVVPALLPPDEPLVASPVDPPDDPPVLPSVPPEVDPPVSPLLPPEFPVEEERGSAMDLSGSAAAVAFCALSVFAAPVSLACGSSGGRGGIAASGSASASGAVADDRVSVPVRVWKDGPESMPPEIIQPTRSPARMLRAMAEPTVGMPTRDPGGWYRYI
jgi:hypothetical protein